MSVVNSCFSEDIWFEILKNLPVKTLGKCRCVCKSWHSLIVSPSFRVAHLKHYTQNTANSLILYKKKSEDLNYEQCVLFRDSAQFTEGNSNLNTFTCPILICDFNWPSFQIMGSVYGLLCLFQDPCIIIWNPILQKCIIIIPMITFRDRLSARGFGYDCRTNDHRIVQIYLSANDKETPLVEVFSVKERTRKIISADYLIDISFTDNITCANCFVNGFIHWVTRDSQILPFRAKSLLMFNVSDEKFEMMELPEAIINMANVYDIFGVFEYQGKLSVSICDQNPVCRTDTSGRCQIWVKREYNDASSWCKIVDVRPVPGIYHLGPVQYLGRNSELLGFANILSRELLYYDTTTGHINEIGFRATLSTSFTAYSESLVFLDQKISDYIVGRGAKLEWIPVLPVDGTICSMARGSEIPKSSAHNKGDYFSTIGVHQGSVPLLAMLWKLFFEYHLFLFFVLTLMFSLMLIY